MKYLQKLGKSLMLPVACLPVASILYGIGYWIDPIGWGKYSVIAAFLIKAASALVDNMAILFAIGIGVGMADENDGAGGLAGLVSWLMITTLLSPESVAMFRGIKAAAVDAAFTKIETQFIGILAGLIGSACYNKFKDTKLPDALAFFGGKRSAAIVTAGVSIIASIILFFLWPVIYGGLVSFGKMIIAAGPVGAGIYAMCNRLLIPFGLHHALNSVFWFDVAGINDIANFWNGKGTLGITGMYMSGFFPVMMFGLPAAALAMYHTARKKQKAVAMGLLAGGAVASFFTGVTEPLEFSFMFLSPMLYVIHAVLTGICTGIVAMLPARAGFNFSAGMVDFILSFKAPMAQNPWMLLIVGLGTAVIYYTVFRFAIIKFDLKTPGRQEEMEQIGAGIGFAEDDFLKTAQIILQGVGGSKNVTAIDNCITRLRLEIVDPEKIDEAYIKSAGISGIMRPGKNNIQVVVGPQVQFVTNEFKKLCRRH